MERCYVVDDTLARLARVYPDTKFIRARAAALGFASTTSAPQVRTSRILRPPRSSVYDRDGDDLDDEEDDGENEVEVLEDEDEVDLDMLPTMLVYRDGELMFNWVRVDWEVGEAGFEELLDRLVYSCYDMIFMEVAEHLPVDIVY